MASLALDPKVAVTLFEELEFLLSLDVDVLHTVFALVAHDFLVPAEQILAAEARLLHLSELEETNVGVAHHRLENVARMFTGK